MLSKHICSASVPLWWQVRKKCLWRILWAGRVCQQSWHLDQAVASIRQRVSRAVQESLETSAWEKHECSCQQDWICLNSEMLELNLAWISCVCSCLWECNCLLLGSPQPYLWQGLWCVPKGCMSCQARATLHPSPSFRYVFWSCGYWFAQRLTHVVLSSSYSYFYIFLPLPTLIDTPFVFVCHLQDFLFLYKKNTFGFSSRWNKLKANRLVALMKYVICPKASWTAHFPHQN